MGYFSNGTAGMVYEERYCSKCVHSTRNGGCPVWDAHLLFAYELAGQGNEKHPGRIMLDMLIPRAPGGGNAQCTMFRPRARGYDAFARIERELEEAHEKIRELEAKP